MKNQGPSRVTTPKAGPVGRSALPGLARCSLCPAGRFAEVEGSGWCEGCPSGRFGRLGRGRPGRGKNLRKSGDNLEYYLQYDNNYPLDSILTIKS